MNSFQIMSKIQVGSILEMNFHEEILLNGPKILIVSSPSVSKFREFGVFVSKLEENLCVSTYTDIVPDAPLQDIEKIIETHEKPNLLIGIGGGSVIDSVKALSVGWNSETITDMFYGKSPLPKDKIKTIAIPTTGGTGAELSYGAILYDRKNNHKGGLRGEILQPEHILIDVDLYLNAPPKLIAETGFDCFTHAVETYISSASSAITKYQSISAIEVFFNHLIKAVQKNRNSMEKMAIASSMMGLNLALSSTCLPHRIQYSLRKSKPHSHAQGLICLYGGWLPMVQESKKFKMMAQDLGLTNLEILKNVDTIKKTLKIDYSLSDFGFDPSDIVSIARNVTGNMTLDPIYKDENTIIQILKNSFK